MSNKRRVNLQLNIAKECGAELPPKATVLDLGCGAGDIVRTYQNRDYQAYGCDFRFKEGPEVAALQARGEIRLIDRKPYRLPFDDDMFDLVVSDQVFEHVQNYPETLAEIRRVLKPAGTSVHFFPARRKVIEPHVKIPFASVNQSYWWLSIWTHLGIRNDFQKDMTAKAAARRSCDYLSNNTNYLPRSEIARQVGEHFDLVYFAERSYLKFCREGKLILSAITVLPFLPRLYSAFYGRVLVFRNPKLELGS